MGPDLIRLDGGLDGSPGFCNETTVHNTRPSFVCAFFLIPLFCLGWIFQSTLFSEGVWLACGRRYVEHGAWALSFLLMSADLIIFYGNAPMRCNPTRWWKLHLIYAGNQRIRNPNPQKGNHTLSAIPPSCK